MPRNIFGLILKNDMAVKGVSLTIMADCVDIFPLSGEQNLLEVEVSNLQDMFINIKDCLGIFLASF